MDGRTIRDDAAGKGVMTKSIEPNALDELRRADPATDDLASAASLARIRARIEESAMHPPINASRGSRPRLRWGIGLAAVLLVAAGTALAIGGRGPASGGGPDASSGPGGGNGIGAASCVETYNPAMLKKRSIAFDGTVTAVNGDEVVFAIGKAFRGVAGGQLTLTATGMTGAAVTSIGGPTFVVGGRYLVAGEDHFAWACGFSQVWDATHAAEWAAAFGT